MDHTQLTDLIVVDHRGLEWQWTDFEIVTNRNGAPVRVERFRRPCVVCGEPFTATQKLPPDAFKRWHRYNPQPVRGTIPVEYKLKTRSGNLQLRTCIAHRGQAHLAPPPEPAGRTLEEQIEALV